MSDMEEESRLLDLDKEPGLSDDEPMHLSNDGARPPSNDGAPKDRPGVETLLESLASKLDGIETQTAKMASLERRLSLLEKGGRGAKRQAPSAPGPNGPSTSKKSHSALGQTGEGEEESSSDEDEMAAAAIFQTPLGTESSANADHSWIADLDDDRDPEYGPPINAQLATLANKRFAKLQNYPKIKELQAQYLIPTNCDGVRVPKVNSEVWHNLAQHQHKFMRTRDVKMASIQKSVVAGSAAILQLLEFFTQASKPSSKDTPKSSLGDYGQLEQMFKTGLHALTLLGHANYDLSLRRRDSMRTLLKQDLAAALCGPEIPVTSYLFGDDFTRSLKEAKQVAQMGRDVKKHENFRRYNSDSKNYRGKWKGKPPYQRKGKRDNKS